MPTNVGIEREILATMQVKRYIIIIDVLGGYSADVSHAGKELVGEKSATILQRIQRSVMSNTPTKHGAQFENSCLKLERGLLLTVLFLEKNYCALKFLLKI